MSNIGFADFQRSTSLDNSPSIDNFYHHQSLQELDTIGYLRQAGQSTFMSGVDWMAQSWDIMNFGGEVDATFDVFGPILVNDFAPPNFISQPSVMLNDYFSVFMALF
jgi:hypothetical protein